MAIRHERPVIRVATHSQGASTATPGSGNATRGFEHQERGDAHYENRGEPSWFSALTTYLNYAILILFGHSRDFIAKITGHSRYFGANSRPPRDYAPLLQDFENFYTRRLFHRVSDCWNRPIAGPPFASKIALVERESADGNYTFRY